MSNTKKQRKMSVKLALSKEGRGRGGGREKKANEVQALKLRKNQR